MYYYDTAHPGRKPSDRRSGPTGSVRGKPPEHNFHIDTVAKNKEMYTKRDVKRAEAVRKLQQAMYSPADRTLIKMLEANAIPGVDFNRKDVINASAIFGPNVEAIKGKTVRTAPESVQVELTEVPPAILSLYRNVTISADIAYANGIPFLLSIGLKIRYITAQRLASRLAKFLVAGLVAIKRRNAVRGFLVRVAKMDREFEPLREPLMAEGILLNTRR